MEGDEVKIVCSGAAALASLNLLVSLGAKRDNIFVADLEGVVFKGRNKLVALDCAHSPMGVDRFWSALRIE